VLLYVDNTMKIRGNLEKMIKEVPDAVATVSRSLWRFERSAAIIADVE